jgi:hypothetical protein
MQVAADVILINVIKDESIIELAIKARMLSEVLNKNKRIPKPILYFYLLIYIVLMQMLCQLVVVLNRQVK